MSYDITFCSYNKCKDRHCDRHPRRLKGWPYPVSMSDFKECENWKDGNHSITKMKPIETLEPESKEYNIKELLDDVKDYNQTN